MVVAGFREIGLLNLLTVFAGVAMIGFATLTDARVRDAAAQAVNVLGVGTYFGKASTTVRAEASPKRTSAHCASGYVGACLPVGRDVDCADVGHPVLVFGNDPHRLDGDNDGVGCE